MTAKENWRAQTALFLTSQLFSLFGSSIVQYAISWHITLETKSGVMLTISLLAHMLPTLLLSPIAGVWADRYNRRNLMIAADGFIALMTLAAALYMRTGEGEIWVLFVLTAVRALGSAVHSPAVGAFLPQIVPVESLMRVNGLNQTLQSMIMLLSPVAAGALIAWLPLGRVFLIDVATASAAIFILYFLVKPVIQPVSAKHASQPGSEITAVSGYWSDMKDGFRYIWEHPFLRMLMAFMAIFLLTMSPLFFLTPLQVARSYGDDVWRLTAIEVAFSGGMLAGGLLITVWQGFRNRMHTIALSLFMCCIFALVLGLRPHFWIYCAAMLVIGISFPLFNTPLTVLLQEKVDGAYLGRVFSFTTMISSITMPLSMLFFGPLSDRVSVEILILLSTPVMLVAGSIMTFSRTMREAGEPLAPQQDTGSIGGNL